MTYQEQSATIRMDRVFRGDVIELGGIAFRVMATESTATGFTILTLSGDYQTVKATTSEISGDSGMPLQVWRPAT